MSELLAAALRFAELGYAVFPCAPGRKQPLTARGFLDATTDADQIEAWWSKHPKANVAIPTAGLVVIDVDGPANPWLGDGPVRIFVSVGICTVTYRQLRFFGIRPSNKIAKWLRASFHLGMGIVQCFAASRMAM